ncbi:MAG: C15orf41 family protein [Candidatus Thermoplasmatota archaeon]|nr:C15orf41 family protein [Candidatus Thermoplasmatota archaeon]MBU4255778.1 C15orf41 family protein [Candidatus Thermoplasmatota archaeon]MCG2825339.1 C15orf41 family protein [Thermoplasmatales archaeon]
MKLEDYKKLYRRLNGVEDVDILCKEYQLTKDALFNILSQKIVRNATARYYPVKRYGRDLVHEWLNGKSFLEIANRISFPPVLTASIILQQYGISKKRFWKYITHLELLPDPRLKKELAEVKDTDWCYSPKAMVSQRKRGDSVENLVKEWLEKRDVGFEREKELKEKYKKTPDFLLKKPLTIDEKKINWIECKASFGDKTEIGRNTKKQFLPYTEMFGKGMVVYWHGFIEDIEIIKNMIIVDRNFFEKTT